MIRRDVVIIGGSLAGAACARELSRLGVDAVAFERDRFPRARVCGGFVSAGGVDHLARLGLREQVIRAGAVAITSAKVRVGSAEIEIPFDRPGLGVSRRALDEIVAREAVEQGRAVSRVEVSSRGFLVQGTDFQAFCRVVVDAAGKLSRFTRRRARPEFGIQYLQPGGRGGVLDFWFFEDGYGGAVSVEGGASNFCFLINKDKLPRYLGRPDCLVTGPLAYDRLPGDYIAVGDAAGMVDPFCGEGMRHALDTGLLAAEVISRGLREGRGYRRMRDEYETERIRRWRWKRAAGAGIRRMLRYPGLMAGAVRLTPAAWINRLWD
jgi:flavin-dependent dehydrogenase